jgi:hypothetical protein
MENPTDAMVAALERDWPGWHVWVVYHAVGGQTWCARRHGEDIAALNAASPEGLAEALRSEPEQ